MERREKVILQPTQVLRGGDREPFLERVRCLRTKTERRGWPLQSKPGGGDGGGGGEGVPLAHLHKHPLPLNVSLQMLTLVHGKSKKEIQALQEKGRKSRTHHSAQRLLQGKVIRRSPTGRGNADRHQCPHLWDP